MIRERVQKIIETPGLLDRDIVVAIKLVVYENHWQVISGNQAYIARKLDMHPATAWRAIQSLLRCGVLMWESDMVADQMHIDHKVLRFSPEYR